LIRDVLQSQQPCPRCRQLEENAAAAACAVAAGRAEEAVETLESAARRFPKHLATQRGLVRAYCAAGRHQDAIPFARQVAHLVPGDPEAACELGTVLLGGGSLEEARWTFRRALALAPQHGGARRGLAEYMRRVPWRDAGDLASFAWMQGQPEMLQFVTNFYHQQVAPQLHQQLLGNCVKIGPNQLPDLWALWGSCSARLMVGGVDLYVDSDRELNARAGGVGPYHVCLSGGLVEALDEREVAFVMGHELTHVACQHVLYLSAADQLIAYLQQEAMRAEWEAANMGAQRDAALWYGGLLGALCAGVAQVGASSASGRARWAANALREAAQVLANWSPQSEITADRGGLIACGDVDPAVSATVKLAVQSRSLAERVNPTAYLAQQAELQAVGGAMAPQGATHPYLVVRANHLLQWGAAEQSKGLLDLALYWEQTFA
jgi:Zn-dependent protease with chaperone function